MGHPIHNPICPNPFEILTKLLNALITLRLQLISYAVACDLISLRCEGGTGR